MGSEAGEFLSWRGLLRLQCQRLSCMSESMDESSHKCSCASAGTMFQAAEQVLWVQGSEAWRSVCKRLDPYSKVTDTGNEEGWSAWCSCGLVEECGRNTLCLRLRYASKMRKIEMRLLVYKAMVTYYVVPYPTSLIPASPKSCLPLTEPSPNVNATLAARFPPLPVLVSSMRKTRSTLLSSSRSLSGSTRTSRYRFLNHSGKYLCGFRFKTDSSSLKMADSWGSHEDPYLWACRSAQTTQHYQPRLTPVSSHHVTTSIILQASVAPSYCHDRADIVQQSRRPRLQFSSGTQH